MIYFFDNSLAVLGFTDNLIEGSITDQLPMLYTISLVLPDTTYTLANTASYVGTKDDFGKFQLFRIKTPELDDDRVIIQGVSKFLDDMEAYAIIPDRRFTDTLPTAPLQAILGYTEWSLGDVSVVTTTGSVNFYYLSPLEAIKKVLAVWPLEVETEVLFDNNQIVQQTVSFKLRGADTGKRYEYGQGALRISYKEDRTNIFTALIGRGKGEETTDEAGNPTGGYGRRIDFSDVVWVSGQNPVDKPLGQNYVEISEATYKYGYAGGTIPRLGVVVFEDISDPVEVLRATYNTLETLSRPAVAYEGEVYSLYTHQTGDRIVLVRPDIRLAYQARVVKRVIDLLDFGNTTLTLGDLITPKAVADKRAIEAKLDSVDSKVIMTQGYYEKLAQAQTDVLFSGNSYTYILEPENEFGLPAGIYSFNAPIDQNPTELLMIRGGKLGISYRPTGSGAWTIQTFGTGQGFSATQITTGLLKGGSVEFNLETGTLKIIDPTDPEKTVLSWDGQNLDISARNLSFEASESITTVIRTEVENIGLYRVDIISTGGLYFKNGVISTILIGRVYKNNTDVTDSIDISRFRWTKTNADGGLDTVWSDYYAGGAKQVTVTGADITRRATFTLDILEV